MPTRIMADVYGQVHGTYYIAYEAIQCESLHIILLIFAHLQPATTPTRIMADAHGQLEADDGTSSSYPGLLQRPDLGTKSLGPSRLLKV
jgi:hypothetical protein